MIRMDEHMYNKYGKKAKTQVSNNHERETIPKIE